MNPFTKAKIYQTKTVKAACATESFKAEVIIGLGRFFRNDWGDMCDEDTVVNEEALKNRDFILAVYDTSMGKVWITAECIENDYYDTIVVLFPEEY